MSFNQFIMKEQYEKVKGLGDRLVLMKEQIDWHLFVPLVRSVFRDNKETGGRPHTDELVVVRSMILQSCYNLSDQELEFQDATFVEADLGRKRYHKEKKAEKNCEEITYTEKQKSHINKDATFSVKHGQVHFGYKTHIKCDVDALLIREYETTSAAPHDGTVDLIEEEMFKCFAYNLYQLVTLKKVAIAKAL